jgi:hypothetical protein
MEAVLLSGEEIASRGKALYEVDEIGIISARHLHAKHPNARLYGIRIGYNVAASLGGVMERTTA